MKTGFDLYDEAEFRKWFLNWAQRTGIRRNPDDPLNKYDFRKAWKDRADPIWNEELKNWEWQPQYKVQDPVPKVDISITINGVPQGQQNKGGSDGV